jgi:hypothetical protein
VHEHIAAYEGKFQFHWRGQSRLETGIDKQGLFIVTGDEPHRELFRSMRLEQRLLQPESTESHQHGEVEYVDLDTGRRFVCTSETAGKEIPWPDGRMEDDRGRVRFEYPRYMHLEERKLDASDYSYILDPLTRIFQAAVETGNPVRWC